MKKLLILLGLFIGLTSFAQNPDYHRYGVRTPFTKYISYTTSQRDALTPSSTDRTIIHHKNDATSINRLEQWDGDSWEELGGDGAVESVQGYIGTVVISPDDLDDFSTLNKFVTDAEKGLISTALQDAPSDGNEYVRKDGDWEVATGGGDNIYNADGTLEGDRSINIAEHSLSVKDSLGMPLLNVANGSFMLNQFKDGALRSTIQTMDSEIDGVGTYIMASNGTDVTVMGVLTYDDYSSAGVSANMLTISVDSLLINISGTTSSPGDVLTLQSDGTTKFQTPSGGGATNAENVIVSPAIGGNTDAYAVMDDHEDRIDALESAGSINTEFQAETYSATFNYAFDPQNPNKYIDLSGNIDIEIFGTVNGDAGNLYLNRGTGSETISFSNGLPPTNLSYPTKPTDVVQLYFVHSDSGVQWYLQNPTQQPKLIQTLLGDGTTTLDFTKGSIVKFLFGATNEVFDIIPPADNTEVVITFRQDATGSRTATLPINFGGVGSTSPAALSTTANALDYRKFDYIDGYFYPTASVNDVQFDTPEPEPITGTIISDTAGFVAGNPPANSFDDETTTQYYSFASGGAWAGYDYGAPVIINRFRILPMQHASTHTTINNARIEYSSNGTTGWTSVYTVSGIDGSNYTNWIDVTFTPVSARYWRVITPTSASYFRIAEIEFFEAE